MIFNFLTSLGILSIANKLLAELKVSPTFHVEVTVMFIQIDFLYK